ncbi:uncharacterized protein N0V89_001636 [Didymosphaeria variabile]|uniref:Ubiquitin-like protease family profile domain-containing protein n=1 Tax=Didymosphaeria variabile TaxID=1932322 RepID=A0A9W9CGX1_9PLEO|nr:uncharacterized protein N0V89_001636 [Didymosphaeria variabile]KAJ4361067.1 hypothetical protein N0V89_001636 [Didymosphaeria variabile]
MSTSTSENSIAISFANAKLTQADLNNNITSQSFLFTDNILTASFNVLQRTLDCPAHQVALLSPNEAQFCYALRQADVHNSPDWDQDYESLIETLADKHFVILPINDGSFGGHNPPNPDGDADQRNVDADTTDDGIKGKHWTLVVADCRGAILKARHFDSFCTNPNDVTLNRIVAEGTMHGLRHLLEARHRPYQIQHIPFREPYTGYDFLLYVKTPHQVGDKGLDLAACGPFVWALASWFAGRFCDGTNEGLGISGFVRRKGNFKNGNFKSEAVRQRIREALEKHRDQLIGIWNTAEFEFISAMEGTGSNRETEDTIQATLGSLGADNSSSMANTASGGNDANNRHGHNDEDNLFNRLAVDQNGW